MFYFQSGKTILSMSALSNHGFLISRKTDLHILECSDSNTTTVNDGGKYLYNIKILRVRGGSVAKSNILAPCIHLNF